MARWEPNTRERLVRAALTLFAEQGYEATTVNEIAERAGGLTKTTFFRHFSDKREVLFAGQEIHGRIAAQAIAAEPESAGPLELVASALDGLAAEFTEDRREPAQRLQEIIATSSDLAERSASKRAARAEAMAQALQNRGVAHLTAEIAGDMGARVFSIAFRRWTAPLDQRPLAEHAREVFAELTTAISTLDQAGSKK